MAFNHVGEVMQRHIEHVKDFLVGFSGIWVEEPEPHKE